MNEPNGTQTEVAQVWVIARGEYDDRVPVAVVQGTKDDAQRYADHYNATYPWTSDEDKAHVWVDVDLVISSDTAH